MRLNPPTCRPFFGKPPSDPHARAPVGSSRAAISPRKGDPPPELSSRAGAADPFLACSAARAKLFRRPCMRTDPFLACRRRQCARPDPFLACSSAWVIRFSRAAVGDPASSACCGSASSSAWAWTCAQPGVLGQFVFACVLPSERSSAAICVRTAMRV